MNQTIKDIAKHYGYTLHHTAGGSTALRREIGGTNPRYYYQDSRPYILISSKTTLVPRDLSDTYRATVYRYRSPDGISDPSGWDQWHVVSSTRDLIGTLSFVNDAVSGAFELQENMHRSELASRIPEWWLSHLMHSDKEALFFDPEIMDEDLPFPDEYLQHWLDGAMDFAIGMNRSTVGETAKVTYMEEAIVAVSLAVGLGAYPQELIPEPVPKPKPGDDLGTDLLNKLYQDFSRDAWALSDMIGRYPGEAEGCAEDYPFSRSFDEEVEHIRTWVETARRRLYEQD